MTWPTTPISTTHLDAGSDNPGLARADIKLMADSVNAIQQEFSAGDGAKLAGIEAGADVTDATNVAAAGGVLSSSVSTIVSLTQAQYDALTPDTNTLYVITE